MNNGATFYSKGQNVTSIEAEDVLYPGDHMPLSDVQITEFMVLWKKSTSENISSEQARLIAARLLHLYRVLVHRIPNEKTFTVRRSDPGEIADLPVPGSS